MKTQVFILIPYDVPPAEFHDFEDLLLESHRTGEDDPPRVGHFDYLVGPLRKSLNDPVAAGRLPPSVRRAYSGNICERANLPEGVVPGALVTPDGSWHDLFDFGWRMVNESSEANLEAFAQWTAHYRELIATYEDCWVVELWAHS